MPTRAETFLATIGQQPTLMLSGENTLNPSARLDADGTLKVYRTTWTLSQIGDLAKWLRETFLDEV